MKKARIAFGTLAIGVIFAACLPGTGTPLPTQDVDAAVQTAVAKALPTATLDIDATIEAGIQATRAAQPTLIPIPTVTPIATIPPPYPDPQAFPHPYHSTQAHSNPTPQ